MSTHTTLLLFFIYLGAMVLVGWFVSRGTKSGETFLMGGRRLGFGLLFGTIIATLVGTGSSMGAVALGYANGFGGALYGLGGGLGILLLTVCFSGMRRYNFMTMTEEIAYYYSANKTVRVAVSIILYLASIGWLGAHILGGSFYLSWITGLDLLTAKIITSLGFGLYVIIGGYLAVVWTDTLQSVFLFVGFIVMAALAVPAAGGFEQIRQSVPPEHLSFLGVQKSGALPALSLALSIAVGVMVVPSFRQRIYTARTISIVKKSFYLSAAAYFFFSVLPVIIGLSAYAIDPHLENTNMAFPFVATAVLPPLLGSFIVICGLSATMSSGDSDALTGVTILLRDVWMVVTGTVPDKKNVVRYSRWAIFLSILLAFLFGIVSEDILGYISKMISTVMSGLFITVLLGRFWRRATWQGAIAALLSGSVISLTILNLPSVLAFWGTPILPALTAALVAHVLFSLLSPRKTVSPEEVLEIINAERVAMDM